jgi:Zn-dependent protease
MLPSRVDLFTLSGIAVRVHASWLPALPLLAWTLADTVFPFLVPELSPAAYWQMAAAGTLGLVLCILVREAAHLFVAHRAAIGIQEITIYIFGGVADGRGGQASTKQEFLIMFTGSFVAFIFGLAVLVLLFQGADATTPLAVAGVLFYLGFASWALALVNLIPAAPFNGGRVLRAALAAYVNLRWASRITAGLGMVLAILLVLSGTVLLMQRDVPVGLLTLLTAVLLYSIIRRP